MPEPSLYDVGEFNTTTGISPVTYETYFKAYQTWLSRLVAAGVIDLETRDQLVENTKGYIQEFQETANELEKQLDGAGVDEESRAPHRQQLKTIEDLPEFSILFRRNLAGQFESTSPSEQTFWLEKYTAPLKYASAQQKAAEQQAEQEARSLYELQGRREQARSAYSTRRAEAASRPFREEGEPQREPEPLPTPTTQDYLKSLAEFSPAMKSYYSGRGGQIFQQFTEGNPQLRQLWWKSLQPQPQPLTADQYAAMNKQDLSRLEAQQQYAAGSPNIQAFLRGEVGTEALDPYEQLVVSNVVEGYNPGQASPLAGLRETVARESARPPGGAEIAVTGEVDYAQAARDRAAREAAEASQREDPWLKYLKQYPFKEEFATLTPRQKGFYSSQYKPPTRWYS